LLRQMFGSVVSILATASLLSALAFDARGYAPAFLSQDQTDKQAPQSVATEIAHWASQLRSSDEEERRQAVLMLMSLGNSEAARAIVPALNDPSPRVRALATNGLAASGDRSFIPVIVERATQDKVGFVRKMAVYGLGRFQSADATAGLVAALKDKDIEVRGAAAVSLGQYQDAAAIPALIGALADKQEFVRARAAFALGVNGRASAQAVPALVRLLAQDKDAEVKRQAATALGLIGESSARPALERAQHSSDPYLSRAALEALKLIR
jgi:HEAT repeat protein